MQLCFPSLVAEPWVPECAEDELLVAIAAVKRGFQAQAVGMDPGAFPVLHHLAATGPSRQSALAEALGLDASTVSRHVRALSDGGLVEASRDPDDGRATVLTITEPGMTFLMDRLRSHRETLRAATSDFTPGERTDLVRLLHKLAAALGGARKENA
jgi:DNA-binding MarR family transcriptional regulator